MSIPYIKSHWLAANTSYNYPPLREFDPKADKFKMARDNRKYAAKAFQGRFFYDTNSKDKKTCIWPRGGSTSWLDDSSGIDWLAVHAHNSICVVTKAEDLDMTRVHSWLLFQTKNDVVRQFRRNVISEVEDIAVAKPRSELRAALSRSIRKPFGIVSVSAHESKAPVNETDEKIFNFYLEEYDRQVSNKECESVGEIGDSATDDEDEDEDIKRIQRIDIKTERADLKAVEKKTIKYLREKKETIKKGMRDKTNERMSIGFLKEKLKENENLSLDATIQIAIGAFQRLFSEEFAAGDIGVSVFDRCHPDYINIKELGQSEIKRHLKRKGKGAEGQGSGAKQKRKRV